MPSRCLQLEVKEYIEKHNEISIETIYLNISESTTDYNLGSGGNGNSFARNGNVYGLEAESF